MSNPKERLTKINAMERDNSLIISPSEAEAILARKVNRNLDLEETLNYIPNKMFVDIFSPDNRSNKHSDSNYESREYSDSYHRPKKHPDSNYESREYCNSNNRSKEQCYSNCKSKVYRGKSEKYQFSYGPKVRRDSTHLPSESRKQISDWLWSSFENSRPSSGSDKSSNPSTGINNIGGFPVVVNGIPIGPTIPIVHRNGVVFLTPPNFSIPIFGGRKIIY